ncbi:MAG: hypothetical protein J3Q66DRAFT_421650 [Benniella sp.]|nr:MAG: hypothetical protein J3Q66DRAFT_421650 [Benniella sp.]
MAEYGSSLPRCTRQLADNAPYGHPTSPNSRQADSAPDGHLTPPNSRQARRTECGTSLRWPPWQTAHLDGNTPLRLRQNVQRATYRCTRQLADSAPDGHLTPPNSRQARRTECGTSLRWPPWQTAHLDGNTPLRLRQSVQRATYRCTRQLADSAPDGHLTPPNSRQTRVCGELAVHYLNTSGEYRFLNITRPWDLVMIFVGPHELIVLVLYATARFRRPSFGLIERTVKWAQLFKRRWSKGGDFKALINRPQSGIDTGRRLVWFLQRIEELEISVSPSKDKRDKQDMTGTHDEKLQMVRSGQMFLCEPILIQSFRL